MGKLPKKRLLELARREQKRFDAENPRPLVMTKDVESRFLAMKEAEARKYCRLCGARLNDGMTSSYRGRFTDWWVRKTCPNCGVVEETAGGVRKTGDKTLGDPFSRVLTLYFRVKK
jgi:RNase P subunit RPR2